MLQPRFTKFKKMHLGLFNGYTNKNRTLFNSNSAGIQALESAWVKPFQIEAARKTISKYVKKLGKLYIRVFPDRSITARAKESRMGAGKGSVNGWMSAIFINTIIFELTGAPQDITLNVLKVASYKLPIKTNIIHNYLKIINSLLCQED